mgnify:FL=1
MSDWTEVLKVVPTFGVQGNEAAINAQIEEFQEKQITPFVQNIVGNLKMGQLPVFKLRVDNNAPNSGGQGDTFVIGRDQIRRLGGDPNRIKAKLQQVFRKAGYSAKGSLLGKDMTVQIPKTMRNKFSGKRMTDPRQMQAMQDQRGFMNRLRRTRRGLNPMNLVRDRRARQYMEDNPSARSLQGSF